jgi:hypothetical protein
MRQLNRSFPVVRPPRAPLLWTGVEAHRPLGGVNRARRGVYRHSADFRAGFNNCPYHEPTGSED